MNADGGGYKGGSNCQWGAWSPDSEGRCIQIKDEVCKHVKVREPTNEECEAYQIEVKFCDCKQIDNEDDENVHRELPDESDDQKDAVIDDEAEETPEESDNQEDTENAEAEESPSSSAKTEQDEGDTPEA